MPEREPDDAPVDEMVESEELGESGSAPGASGLVESPEPGHGQFQEAYDSVPDEVAAVGSIKHDDQDETPSEDSPTS